MSLFLHRVFTLFLSIVCFCFFSLGCVYLCFHLPCTFARWVPILDFIYTIFLLFGIKYKVHQCYFVGKMHSQLYYSWICQWNWWWPKILCVPLRMSITKIHIFLLFGYITTMNFKTIQIIEFGINHGPQFFKKIEITSHNKTIDYILVLS